MTALNRFVKQEPPPYQIDALAAYLIKVKNKFFSHTSSYCDILTSVAIRAGMNMDKLPNWQALEERCNNIAEERRRKKS
jgi:hypothetical protein